MTLFKRMAALAIVVMVVAFVTVALNRGVKLRVENVGAATLEDVVVTVSGVEDEVGDVEPGETVVTGLDAVGEVGLVELTWKVGDRSSYGRVEGYFEGSGYNGEVVFVIDGLAVKEARIEVEPGFF